MSVVWGMDHIWQAWIASQTTAWSLTTVRTYSAVTLDVGTRSLNHRPHQWYSGLRMMVQIWICYRTILWVLCEVWTISDRFGSPHRLRHDLQLLPWHTQLLPCILEPRASWTMYLISCVVVQGWWHSYRYFIPPFMSVIWGMDHAWQTWVTPQTTS